jgi:hypothetical protein
MANKQDKPNAMKPEVVQKILGIPTYPMVAIDKDRRDEMLRILMNAAAQYVGVALPDLPAAELLKFTDAATEEAIAEVDAEEEEEEEEEYEEVYVDEDGKVIEDLDEYEIIEEEVEVEEIEVEEEEPEPEVEEEEAIEEPIVEEEIEVPVEADEVTEEVEVQIEEVPEPEPEPEPEIVEAPVVDVEVEEEVPEPEAIPPELVEEPVDVATDDGPVVVDSVVDIAEALADDSGPVLVVEENTDAIKMAKDIIFEALETDDFDEIIATEIDQASDEEIDTALQAISSDETKPIADEPIESSEIDAESLVELEKFLGPLDRSVGGTGALESDEDGDEEDTYLPLNGDTLAELDKLLESAEDTEKED